MLLFLRGGFDPLPRQPSVAEIDEHITQGFQIIAPGLFNTEMRLNGSESRRPCETFVLAVGNVSMRFRVQVHLSETKVNYVDSVATFADTHEEIGGLDVAVEKRVCMNILNATNLRSQRGIKEGMLRAGPQEARLS